MTFGAKIVRGLMRLVGSLPLGFHYACARVIAWFLYSVMHYRRDVVMINVSRSFPDKKYDEIKKIVKASYLHMADIIVEAIWFGACSPERIKKQNVAHLEGFEEVEQSYKTSPGIVVLNSHLGNWEMTAGILEFAQRPTVIDTVHCKVVYKALKSKTWDQVMADNRCRFDFTTDNVVESSNVLRYAITHKAEKMVYIFPTDQYPYKNASAQHVDDFMHQKTVAITGGAAVAKMLSMSVFILNIQKERRGHYAFRFVKLCDDASQYTPVQIMNMYYAELQKAIEECPENYLWTHKRWKHKDSESLIPVKK